MGEKREDSARGCEEVEEEVRDRWHQSGEEGVFICGLALVIVAVKGRKATWSGLKGEAQGIM